jgi:hypothetical protein
MTWVVRHDPFFWDTVQLASKHAHFFYQHHLQWAVLPANIDSGHPPLLGYYLACIWTYVGYSLPVSHFSILPFLCLLIWSLYRLGLRLGGRVWAFWLIPLVLLDPVVAGQSVLVSPDIILLSFFLLSLEGILGNQKIYIFLGVLGLCVVSMRGMMCVAGLGVFMTLLALKNRQSWQYWSTQALSFVPGVLAAFAFLYGHWQAVGWIGYHAGSEWSPAFQRADAWGIVRNIAVLGWRWLDFGRVFEWILLLGLSIRVLRNRAPKPAFTLILLLGCMCFFLSISAVLYQNLSAHRYFLPAYCCLHLLLFQGLIVSNLKESFIRLTFVALITALAAGNFWVYPRGISMDWDATLAHQPYHALRAQAMAYLDQEGIDYQQVGTAFPNLNTGVDLMLNDDIRRFSVIRYDQNQLIFVSNIMNDVEVSDYHRLEAEWVRVRRFEQAGVWIELYRRKNQ